MRRPGTQRGFALLAVLIIVGVAVVLSFAVLSETSLKAQASKNAALAAQADALCDSGVNLAMYYLLNPWNAPTLQNGYWPGGSGISLGASVSGAIDVTVVKDLSKTNEYVITAMGKPQPTSSSGLCHTAQARVRIQPGLKISRSISAVKAMTLSNGVTVNGDVACNGSLTNAAIINGTAYSNGLVNTGLITTIASILTVEPAVAPTATSIQQFATYAYADGRLYSRTAITTASIGSGVNETPGPTASNPAGIYYYNGNLTLNNNVKISGTLVVTGNVILNGTGISITPQNGFPGLIVLGEFRTRAGKSMTIDGTTFVGKVVKPDGASSIGTAITFNGALLFGDNGGIQAGSGTNIKLNITNASKLILPDLDTAKPRSVTVLSWKQ